MGHQWNRIRGLVHPQGALQPGGFLKEVDQWKPGDNPELLDDIHAREHNPANGRVPPQIPSPPARPKWPDFPDIAVSRFFTQTPTILNDAQLGFQARSVRIDNYSSHWLYLSSCGMYVPPFTYCSVMPIIPAVASAQWIIQPPPGHIEPTPILESVVVSIWYMHFIEPTAGLLCPST